MNGRRQAHTVKMWAGELENQSLENQMGRFEFKDVSANRRGGSSGSSSATGPVPALVGYWR